MPSQPSPLHIATQAVARLVKEEKYYHTELAGQRERVARREAANGVSDDVNAEFALRQEKAAILETEKVFGPLHKRIEDAVQKLEEQIALSESEGAAEGVELEKAREALKTGKEVVEKED